jgi:hypothetical protein
MKSHWHSTLEHEFEEGAFLMSHAINSSEERFDGIVAAFAGVRDVTLPSDEPQSKQGFGSSALRIHNKIFAMLVQDRLVVKLPKPRVDTLVAAGDGERFDPRHDGRVMKEWLVVASAREDDWLALAQEAMKYVASQN